MPPPPPDAVLLRDLESDDQHVRASAAVELARIGHPDALRASLRTLNDAPDELHQDVTPAVHTLAAMGLAAAAPLLDRLLDDDAMTRLRAARALERIVGQAGGDWGDYDSDAPSAESVERWRRWLVERGA